MTNRQMEKSETCRFAHLMEFQTYFGKLCSQFQKGDIGLLSGPLGVGKTQLVASVVAGLYGSWVSSPSFNFHQSYGTKSLRVNHIDLFRIKDDGDLESTGFWDFLEDTEGLLLIEWADRLEDQVWPPPKTLWQIHLSFEPGQDQVRNVTIKKWGPMR